MRYHIKISVGKNIRIFECNRIKFAFEYLNKDSNLFESISLRIRIKSIRMKIAFFIRIHSNVKILNSNIFEFLL